MTSSEGLPLPAAGVSCLRPVCELFFFSSAASGCRSFGSGWRSRPLSRPGEQRGRQLLSSDPSPTQQGVGLQSGRRRNRPHFCLPALLLAAGSVSAGPAPPTHTHPQSVMGGWFAGRGGSAPQPPASSALHWGIIVIESWRGSLRTRLQQEVGPAGLHVTAGA